ncbi:hypothetical protein F4810DRAFT_693574 [Camillea tinctor]|nr:hypothetical protein F4810DRAFT_693574 [Camillea tinctor]
MSFFYLASNGFSLPTQPTHFDSVSCHVNPATQEIFHPSRTHALGGIPSLPNHLSSLLRDWKVCIPTNSALHQGLPGLSTHSTARGPANSCTPFSKTVRNNQAYNRAMASSRGGSPTPTGTRQRRLPRLNSRRPSPSTPTPVFKPSACLSGARGTRGPATPRETTTNTGLPLVRGVVRPPSSKPSPMVRSSAEHGSINTQHSSYQPLASTSSRKLSASYSTDGPLSGYPTTAYSSITASSSNQDPLSNHPGPLTSHPITAYASIGSSQSRCNLDTRPRLGALKTSHTYSSLPVSSQHHHQRDLRRASPTSIPPSKASIATSYATATVPPHALTENIRPSASTASISTCRETSLDTSQTRILPQPASRAKNKSRIGIPKSRTFNVFSSLASSFSRTSLGSFTRSESRHTSASSGCTGQDTAPGALRPGSSGSSLASAPSQTRAYTTPALNNPRQIHTAQSSAYWTGRFMALQDRFRSELLMPDNMNTLVTAHAERSMIGASQPPFGGGSLATSATTSCLSNPNVTPRSARRVVTNTMTTPHKSSISPRKQQHKRQMRQANPVTPIKGQNKHKHTSSTSTIFSNAASSNHSSSEAAALLNDEDNRTHRVFLHLEALCTTNEARSSLRAWQQTYARRVGKPNLLPQGGTMHDGDKGDGHHHGQWRDRTWVGRLLSGSSSNASSASSGHVKGVKRGSLGF